MNNPKTNDMKTKSILAMAMAAVMAVVACKKVEPETPAPNEPTPEIPAALEMNFTASLYEFTKATDTSFENGDVIGVNVFNPECYLYNAKYTYNNGALTAAVANEWYEDENLEATITAVYPCSDTMEGYVENQSFMVNADQSAKAGYAASDLMLAVTKSKPTADAVKLPFKHALSKIVVTVDNQLGEDIAQLWFTDVLGSVTYNTADPLATLAATGSKGTVKAYKNANNTWQLIVAPQTASPKLALTTTSGKQFTFVLTENVTFTSGKMSTATVTVSKESIYTAFTPEIQDWVADNELNFSQEEVPAEPTPEDPTPEQPNPENPSTEVRIYISNAWGWTYLWCWDAAGNQIFEGAAWPGTVYHGEENGYYYWVVPEKYVGTTVSLLAAKKTETEEEQSKDFTDVVLSEDVYFYLNWTEETGVQLIRENK